MMPRELIWWVLGRKNMPQFYIDIIKDMYEGAVTSVRSVGGISKEFPVTVGVHQGSALNPYLFTLVMDELTRELQNEVPWCMLFADDIVLVDETKEGLSRKLDNWRETLEKKGFKISRTCRQSKYHSQKPESTRRTIFNRGSTLQLIVQISSGNVNSSIRARDKTHGNTPISIELPRGRLLGSDACIS